MKRKKQPKVTAEHRALARIAQRARALPEARTKSRRAKICMEGGRRGGRAAKRAAKRARKAAKAAEASFRRAHQEEETPDMVEGLS